MPFFCDIYNEIIFNLCNKIARGLMESPSNYCLV